MINKVCKLVTVVMKILCENIWQLGIFAVYFNKLNSLDIHLSFQMHWFNWISLNVIDLYSTNFCLDLENK